MCAIEVHVGYTALTTGGRKKERTTDLVVSAVLKGFRAIDTGVSALHPDGLLPPNTTPSQRVSPSTTSTRHDDFSKMTAEISRSEELVGEALEILQAKHGIRREDLWIQTK